MIRVLTRSVAAILAAALLSYPMDWLVWRVRVAAGNGMGTVAVSRFTVASLKGNKEEYYPEGDAIVDCSRSFYPQSGAGACWWIRRHPQIIERY